MDYDATAGEASRFSPVTDTDHAGNLWILAILAVAYSLLTAAIRFCIKWGVLGADDGLFGIAVVRMNALGVRKTKKIHHVQEAGTN